MAPSEASPQGGTLSLTQNTTLDITISAMRVAVHVQDAAGNPVSNVDVQSSYVSNGNLTLGTSLGTLPASGTSDIYHRRTDSNGDLVGWLFPTPSGQFYSFTATPPSSMPLLPFTVQGVPVVGDITVVIQLQFVHPPPVTTATTSPQPNPQGQFAVPVTVTLSATATSGFTVAATKFIVDGGATQAYTGPFVVSGDGAHSVKFWSIDNLGVQETPKTLNITIVTVVNRAPVAKCKNVTVSASASCSADASINDGSFDPDAGDTITVTQTPAGPYPPGVTQVTLTVTDNHGASASCTAAVTVVAPPPVIVCPANISVNAAPGQCAVVVSFAATATDNCPGVTISYVPASGSTFAVGTTTVTATATGASGNTASCSFTVTVKDTEKPLLVGVPADVTVECNAVPAPANVTATDNCDTAPTVNVNEVRVDGNCPGKYVLKRIWTAKDASGNVSSLTQTITVQDTKAPVITTAAANLTVECDGVGNTASLNAWLASNGGASAADNCGQVTWTRNFTALSDGCGETGSASVTFTATDACGNSSSTTATFAIIDTTAPTLTWKVNNVVVDNALVCNITPNQVPVTNTVSAAEICGPAFLNPIRVTCHAINGAGKIVDKRGSCVISISGGTVTIINSGGVGTFITIFASAIDECGNSTGEKKLIIQVKNPGSGGSGGTKGNEGVGNGVDGNTPGHDNNGGNDDPGSSPGNPGAKNKN